VEFDINKYINDEKQVICKKNVIPL